MSGFLGMAFGVPRLRPEPAMRTARATEGPGQRPGSKRARRTSTTRNLQRRPPHSQTEHDLLRGRSPTWILVYHLWSRFRRDVALAGAAPPQVLPSQPTMARRTVKLRHMTTADACSRVGSGPWRIKSHFSPSHRACSQG